MGIGFEAFTYYHFRLIVGACVSTCVYVSGKACYLLGEPVLHVVLANGEKGFIIDKIGDPPGILGNGYGSRLYIVCRKKGRLIYSPYVIETKVVTGAVEVNIAISVCGPVVAPAKRQ